MDTLKNFTTGSGSITHFHSLPALQEQGFPKLDRLPVSIRIVLESLLRNFDGKKVTGTDITNLAGYDFKNPGYALNQILETQSGENLLQPCDHCWPTINLIRNSAPTTVLPFSN